MLQFQSSSQFISKTSPPISNKKDTYLEKNPSSEFVKMQTHKLIINLKFQWENKNIK